MEDRELAGLLARREEQGAEELLRRCGPMLRYIIAPILSDPREREECLNDVVLLAWEKIESYDPKKGGFSAWLSALARNTARNRRRDGARRFRSAEELGEHLEDRRPGPEEALLHRERLELLQKAVERLGDMDRNLFYRKYYYLQSTAQMAAELGLTERGVEGRLHRLRKRLRKELGGELDG